MERYKKLGISALIVGLSSLLYIDFFISNFKFTFAGAMFPLVLYIYDDCNPVAVGLASGLSVLLLRGFFYGVSRGIWGPQFYYLLPEIMFYIAYGLMFYLVKRVIKGVTYGNIFIISFLIDIIANMLETYLRLRQNLFYVEYKIVRTLLLVGLIRASLVWLIIVGYEYYKMFLIRAEHEKRYRNLLQLTSQLKTETYWMEKNMDYIEGVMSKAYQLFTNINEDGNRQDWAKEALEIATDIHEIKKEYNLVIVGIEDIMSTRVDNTGMYFYELITILEESSEREVRARGKDIKITYNVGENFYTNNHYYLMSVLRNIIMNAIDSIEEKGSISVFHKILDNQHEFIIRDDGRGIREKDLSNVFSPGYSTKIDYSTGEINRGLGLALVNSIVEVHLNGKIKVESEFGKGCTFFIWIPVEEMEGINC